MLAFCLLCGSGTALAESLPKFTVSGEALEGGTELSDDFKQGLPGIARNDYVILVSYERSSLGNGITLKIIHNENLNQPPRVIKDTETYMEIEFDDYYYSKVLGTIRPTYHDITNLIYDTDFFKAQLQVNYHDGGIKPEDYVSRYAAGTLTTTGGVDPVGTGWMNASGIITVNTNLFNFGDSVTIDGVTKTFLQDWQLGKDRAETARNIAQSFEFLIDDKITYGTERTQISAGYYKRHMIRISTRYEYRGTIGNGIPFSVSVSNSGTGTCEEKDPFFSSWAYDYNTLINKPDFSSYLQVTQEEHGEKLTLKNSDPTSPLEIYAGEKNEFRNGKPMDFGQSSLLAKEICDENGENCWDVSTGMCSAFPQEDEKGQPTVFIGEEKLIVGGDRFYANNKKDWDFQGSKLFNVSEVCKKGECIPFEELKEEKVLSGTLCGFCQANNTTLNTGKTVNTTKTAKTTNTGKTTLFVGTNTLHTTNPTLVESSISVGAKTITPCQNHKVCGGDCPYGWTATELFGNHFSCVKD